MMILAEERYKLVKRDCENGLSFCQIASKHTMGANTVSRINSTLDYEDYLKRYNPAYWSALQRKKKIGDHVVPSGEWRDPNERLMSRIHISEEDDVKNSTVEGKEKKAVVKKKQTFAQVPPEEKLVSNINDIIALIKEVKDWESGTSRKVINNISTQGWNKRLVKAIWEELITAKETTEKEHRQQVENLVESLMKDSKGLEKLAQLI